MKKACTLCGCTYGIYTFKAGHVCEDCLRELKTDHQADSHVHTKK